MAQTRADRPEEKAAALRIARRDEMPARPAWRVLTWTLGLAMALWATGILEVPTSERRLVDWIGAFTVLVVFVVWVRVNASPLAMSNPEPGREDRVRIRVIRSQRPPLDAIGRPDIRPPLRRRVRRS